MPEAWWFIKEGDALATVDGTYQYSISDNWSDYLSMRYMRFRYAVGDVDVTYPLSWEPLHVFYNLKMDANQSEDDYAAVWTHIPPDSSSTKGYIGIHPTSASADCELKPVYSFDLSSLDSFGDTIVVPKPRLYIDYGFYRIFDEILNDEGNANKYNSRVQGSILSLKKRLKRQTGQPELFRYRGQRGFSRLFGEQGRASSSDLRESQW